MSRPAGVFGKQDLPFEHEGGKALHIGARALQNVSTVKAALMLETRRGMSASVARRMRRGGANLLFRSASSVMGWEVAVHLNTTALHGPAWLTFSPAGDRAQARIGLKTERGQIAACISCKPRKQHRISPDSPVLDKRCGNETAACTKCQHQAENREWILQISRTRPAQARLRRGVTDTTIGADLDQRGCVLKGRLVLLCSGRRGPSKSREAGGSLRLPARLRRPRETMTPVGVPRAGRETTQARSAEPRPTEARIRKIGRSRERADCSATARTTQAGRQRQQGKLRLAP